MNRIRLEVFLLTSREKDKLLIARFIHTPPPLPHTSAQLYLQGETSNRATRQRNGRADVIAGYTITKVHERPIHLMLVYWVVSLFWRSVMSCICTIQCNKSVTTLLIRGTK